MLLPYVRYRDRLATTLPHISTTNNKVHNQTLFTSSMGSYTTMPSFIRDKLTTYTAIHLSDYNDVTQHATLTSCIRWILGYIAFFARYASNSDSLCFYGREPITDIYSDYHMSSRVGWFLEARYLIRSLQGGILTTNNRYKGSLNKCYYALNAGGRVQHGF